MKIKYIIEFEEEVTPEDVHGLLEDQLPLAKDYLNERLTKTVKQHISKTAQNINIHLDLLED